MCASTHAGSGENGRNLANWASRPGLDRELSRLAAMSEGSERTAEGSERIAEGSERIAEGS